MTPEGKVKAYLRKRIKALGGEVRFVKWIGRRDCLDTRIFFLNGGIIAGLDYDDFLINCWVETKAKAAGGKLSKGQEREIEWLRDMGEKVLVLTSIEAIDKEFPL